MIFSPVSTGVPWEVALSDAIVCISASASGPKKPPPTTVPVTHTVVYRQEGRFGGWPANHGIWSWGDEILVGFTSGYFKDVEGFHALDKTKPLHNMQARSLDGGSEWTVESDLAPIHPMGAASGFSREGQERPTLSSPESPLDFSDPDVVVMCGMSGFNRAASSWFHSSSDRGKSWAGPFAIPQFERSGIYARTDVLPLGASEALFLLTASKTNGRQGMVFATQTTDGGRTFSEPSWLGSEPDGFEIMPSTLRLGESRLLTVVRGKSGDRNFLSTYLSLDLGATWTRLDDAIANTGRGGSPPALLNLKDGRLCLIYGYRDAPSGIRARLSPDQGRMWGNEVILRDDGGNHDLGYPRAVQRPDGRVVVVYYFNDDPAQERYIASTIFDPADIP